MSAHKLVAASLASALVLAFPASALAQNVIVRGGYRDSILVDRCATRVPTDASYRDMVARLDLTPPIGVTDDSGGYRAAFARQPYVDFEVASSDALCRF